jgi:hypothetical protein
MKAYFVTNDQRYSRFFLWLLNTNTSHTGIGFSVNGYDFVVDCNKPYGKHYLLKQWLMKYRIVVTMDVKIDEETERNIYNLAINRVVNKPYDMGAYYYGAYRGFLKKFLGIPFPKTNAWSVPDKWCCTELYTALADAFNDIGIPLDGLVFDALTPEMIEMELRSRTSHMENVTWS